MKTWKLSEKVTGKGTEQLTEYVVTDENGMQVCSRNNRREAVRAALLIAAGRNRGAVQVVGE